MRYEKDIGERTYYAVQAVPDTKAQTLYIVTAYIGANKTGASQLIDAKGSNVNVQDGSVVAPKGKVSQNQDNVKQKYSRELDSEYMELAKDPEGNSTELTVEQMAYDVMARAAGVNRQKATKADQAVERATEELNRLLKAGRTRERARIEQNQQTTYRQQIKNVSEKFQRMLLRPGKGATQHAPANLVGAVRSFCELFNDSEMRRAARWQLTLDTFFNYVCGCI